jgi:phosphoribosylaminoimidazole-succinocarboxamide synthase
MELVKTGKTKDVYNLGEGKYLFKFKDTVTGNAATGESDPGGNQVVGSVTGVGSAALKMSVYYFELLKKNNIATHYVSSDLSKNEMVVQSAVFFGKGLEFVVRYKATGSFIRRFGLYCKEGDELPPVFEVTLKDDDREDPPVTREILAVLKLLTPEQYDEIRNETIKICGIVRDDLKKRGLELIDMKVEFAMVNGKIALIDEMGPGNMRVYKDGKSVGYITLSNLVQ